VKPKLNYYLILNISQTAEAKDIRNSYLKLAKKYHPDKNKGNKLAEKKFQQINMAYQVLKNPQKRQAFDKEWEIFKQTKKSPPINTKEAPKQPEAQKPPEAQKKQPDDLWTRVFKNKREEKPIDVEIPLEVSVADLCQGSVKKISFLKPYNGGHQKSSIEIPVPKGSRPGNRLQFKRKGGSNGKKIYGNLILTLQLKHHPFFKVNGDHIHLTCPIPFTEAFKGTAQIFLTPYGKIRLDIPPNTKHDQIFRLKNLGLPNKSESRGTLFVRIFVDYPKGKRIQIQNEMKNLSAKNKDLYIQKYASKKPLYEKVLSFQHYLNSTKDKDR